MEYVHKWLAPRRTGVRASFWDEMREASRKVAEYEARRAAEAGAQRAAAHPARSADAIRANHRPARAAAPPTPPAR